DLTQALKDAQAAKAEAEAAIADIVDDFPTEAGAFDVRLDALTDIVIPPVTTTPTIDALDDEFILELGQETRLPRDIIEVNNVALLDVLGSNQTDVAFTVPADAEDNGATSNIRITVSQDDLLSIGEAVQVVVYQQTNEGTVKVASANQLGGVVTLGGVNLLGIVGDTDSITIDLANLPEGDYFVKVEADNSTLTNLIRDVAIADLGGEGAILGGTNQEAVLDAINTVLGNNGISQTLISAVNLILAPVNAGLIPVSSVVNNLLEILPIDVLDDVIDILIAPVLSNLLTVYENVAVKIEGTDELFENYQLNGNIFDDNGRGADLKEGAVISAIDGELVGTSETEVIVEGTYGVLTIDPTTGEFTYTVTAGEAAIGQTEIFDYTLSDGQMTDTAQIILDITGTPVDPSELLPEDNITQIVANDDLATVQNYYEEPGDELNKVGGVGGLLNAQLAGMEFSVGSNTAFNFVVDKNETSDVEITVSGSATLGLLNVILGSRTQFDAILQRTYVDDSGVAQTEIIQFENAITLNRVQVGEPLGIPLYEYQYQGVISRDDLGEGTYLLLLKESSESQGLLQAILEALGTNVSLFTNIEFEMTAQTDKYLGSNEITGNVLNSSDGADVVNSSTFVTKVVTEIGDTVTLSSANTVIGGAYGTLYISPNGTYKYVSNGDVTDFGKVDTFTYTIRDFNGSEDTAELNIRIDGENSGIVWSADPTASGVLPELVLVPNTETTTVPKVTNVTEVVTTSPGTFNVSAGVDIPFVGPVGGSGTFNSSTTNTFTIANTDSADVVLTVSMPALSLSVLPTFTLIVRDAGGAIVGSVTGTPLTGVLGTSRSLVVDDLGPGTYTIEASANGNTGVGFTATLSLEQTLTHYNQIESLSTPEEIEGNLLADDTYNPSYSTFKVLTSQGYQEVGYNGVTIQGEYGSLFVERDGTYTYTPDNGVIGRQDTFEYSLEIFGQASQFSTLTVTVPAITQGDGERNTLVSSESDDSFIGGLGGDVVIFNLLNSLDSTGGNGKDIWTDYSQAQGDVIDISALLSGQTVDSSNIGTFVTLDQNGLDTVVSIDLDGMGTQYNPTELIVLQNTDSTTLLLDELLKYNNPI
ncbi:type I secretion C-terminal target domain-containing protein, partial [Acinetobacter sp. 187]|uniref:BapA/Bap/LapF family large adhesin n=1 Tax=Acinetobacter lanii TaxID=2715163 RepID=UPI00140DB5B8